ncbi:regulator of G-protein signaling 22-like [Hemiscyllium ocellatum]|uniref:regulator of G-protein signaling 22-like n=1 Tax=Hemiscyllium ocellatum TaxID=170820 RepID=UPI002965F5AA|nr:regulator of G-protein signaling 22-like [Hemiscyllium ocellatum]
MVQLQEDNKDEEEDYLVTDDLLVDYFNVFLSLFDYPKPIWFNKEIEVFEIVDNAKKNLIKHLRNLEHSLTPMNTGSHGADKSRMNYPPQNLTPADLNFETSFTVQCLDQEQGVSWIRSERLPAFLKSDCYFEYRLAKLLAQLDHQTGSGTLQVDSSYYPWVIGAKEESISEMVDKTDLAMKELYICFGQASVTQTKALFTEAKEDIPLIVIQTERKPIFAIETSVPSSRTSSLSLERELSSYSLLHEIMMSVEARMLPVRKKINRRYSSRTYFETDHRERCSTGHSKPKVVDNELFEFVPEYPLQAPATVFLRVRSEIDTEENEDQDSTENSIETQEGEINTASRATERSETDLSSENDQTTTPLNNSSVIDSQVVPKLTVLKTSQQNEVGSSEESDNTMFQALMTGVDEESMETTSSSEDDIRHECYVPPRRHYNFKNSKGIEKFKKFLHGTAGEKYWWLWMDIERLKVIKDAKKSQSFLNHIRNRYMCSNGEFYLNAETRAKLDLSFVSNWTLENLCQIQSKIVIPLLQYWGPRYCVNQGIPLRKAGTILKDWEDRHLRPKSQIGLYTKTAMPMPIHTRIVCTPEENENNQQKYSAWGLKPDSATHISPKLNPPKPVTENTSFEKMMESLSNNVVNKDNLLTSVGSIWSQDANSVFAFENLKLHKSKQNSNLEKLMRITNYQEALCDYKMDNLLQALHKESRTGYLFTSFCEQTGNPLWKNCINLWFDLKEYQRLFYAEVFQPFKLRRQAQFIFAKYIVDKSPEDVEIGVENKKIIYQELEPPFEELFDDVELYVLILLLVPWMHMIEMDMSKFRKVELIKETRHLDSIYYKKLEKLQKSLFPNEVINSVLPKQFILPARSISLVHTSDNVKGSNYWQTVPEEFCNYTLDALVRNRLELENFQAFLRENLAGMDLKCWMDIEYFRRIPHNEKETRDITSKAIKIKYLNRQYFFGPSSPATKVQQNDVMILAGGWGKLLHDKLSSDILIEVQKYVKLRLERKWLPMFLASPEFVKRHHQQVQMHDVVEDQMLQKSKKKVQWNKWLASSKEIIAFRKTLLNPITAFQFQQFVSLKGERMQNNVIFWLEVQKYKEMFHSQASEETVQNKISSIINCFINSSIPPPIQIDISPECAQRIINYNQDQGPYVFREAQLTVFDLLFKLWPDFLNFRHGVADESVLPTLERKLMRKYGSVEKSETKPNEGKLTTENKLDYNL